MKININNLFIFIEQKKNDEVISYLQENGMEIKDEFGRTALMNASFYNNSELIKLILEIGADINAKDINGYTSLHFASQEANDDCVSILLQNNATVNIQDNNGNTPVWVCIMHWKGGKNKKNLQLLYNVKADFDIKNNAGKSAKDIIPQQIMDELRN